MTKVIKKIPAFLLLLAGIVILAHQTIPHDHHLSESINRQDDSCPFSKKETSHHPGFPLHCHAFNDLTSEKVTIILLRDNIRNNSLFISDVADDYTSDLQLPLVTFVGQNELLPDSDLLELSLLRAPPSFV